MEFSGSKAVKCTGSLPVVLCDVCRCMLHTVEVSAAFLVAEQELVVLGSQQQQGLCSALPLQLSPAPPTAADSAQGLMVRATQQDA